MPAAPPRRFAKPVPVLVQASLQRLGQRVKVARKLRQMTQEDLARLADVAISTVRALEEGADGVALGNFCKVLAGLQLLEQCEALLDPARDPEAAAFALRKLGEG